MAAGLPARGVGAAGPDGGLPRRSRDLTPWLVGAITVLVLFVFLLYPIAKTMLSSFVPQGEALSLRNLSLSNFERFWTSPLYKSALRNSLVVSLTTTLIATLLALPAAYALARIRIDQMVEWCLLWLGIPALDLAITTFYLRGGDEAPEVALREGYASIAPLPDVSPVDFEAVVASRQLLLANSMLTTSTSQLRAMARTYLPTSVDRLQHWLETGHFTRQPPEG